MNITKEDFWDSLKFTLQTWANTELIVFPRSSNLPLELRNKFWVYILFSNINQEGKVQTYIGESNNLYERISQHLEKKEFWNIAYIFTDKDLNKTLNLSLEKVMIKLVRETKHPYYPFVCDNVSQWSYQPLKDEEKKYLVSVLENIQLLLDINQVPLFLKPNWVLFSSLNIQEKKTRTKTKSSLIHKEFPLFNLWWATLKVENNRFILFSFDLYVLAKIYKLNTKEEKAQGEYGLESLGKPTNDYFKNEFSKNDKVIEIVSDGKDYSNVDFGENVGDKKNDGYNEYKYDLRYTYQEKINENIYSQSTKILSKTYTEKELQETIDKNYGKGYYKIDWNRYTKDDEYREQTNYYFYQAKHFVKAKTIDKIGEDYIEITRDNGEKLKLKEIEANQAIYHNIERKNGAMYFNFSEKTRYKKYVNEDGYELILDQNYKPVYDPVVVGTYNFHTYDGVKNPIDLVSHTKDIGLWVKYGTGPNDPTTRGEREKIGNLFFGYKIQNNYDEIKNELKARGKDKASLNELTEILEKISGEKRLKMISE